MNRAAQPCSPHHQRTRPEPPTRYSANQAINTRLRALAGPDIDDPRLVELVGELSVRSDRFRRLWARHDIRAAARPVRTFNHPLVGAIELWAEWLAIAGADGQLLVVFHAVPGSRSEQALIRLAGMTAGEQGRSA